MVSRRAAVRAGGVALLAGLAGCSGGSGSGDTPPGGQMSSDSPTLATHPAGRAVADQPHLGPPPGEATATVVAFEDPSCPTCARFHRETFPEVRANLTEPGEATFVSRGIPVVYDWSEPATRALEATFARDAGAYWALADHYFSNGSSFRSGGVDEVLPATAAFLDDETAVDGSAVVADVEGGDADAAVERDLDASRDAEVRSTPTLFLFRGGALQTQVRGSVSYDVLRGALGL